MIAYISANIGATNKLPSTDALHFGQKRGFGPHQDVIGAAGIQPIVRLLSSGRGGSGGDGHSGWWVVGARVWELVKVIVVEWKLFAMTWRLLVRCCE